MSCIHASFLGSGHMCSPTSCTSCHCGHTPRLQYGGSSHFNEVAKQPKDLNRFSKDKLKIEKNLILSVVFKAFIFAVWEKMLLGPNGMFLRQHLEWPLSILLLCPSLMSSSDNTSMPVPTMCIPAHCCHSDGGDLMEQLVPLTFGWRPLHLPLCL